MSAPFRFSRSRCTLLVTMVAVLAIAPASGASLAEKAKESGCINKPRLMDGQSLYKCETGSGASSYFNVPPDLPGSPAPGPAPTPPPNGGAAPPPEASKRNGNGSVTATRPTTPGFPRVDAETQKGRDDMRRRVLADELATEEKLLTEARAAYADGAPTPLPEERTNADRYRERIARLRQAVVVHERNIEALRKELGNTR